MEKIHVVKGDKACDHLLAECTKIIESKDFGILDCARWIAHYLKGIIFVKCENNIAALSELIRAKNYLNDNDDIKKMYIDKIFDILFHQISTLNVIHLKKNKEKCLRLFGFKTSKYNNALGFTTLS